MDKFLKEALREVDALTPAAPPHPGNHMHDFLGLTACCTIDGAFHVLLMEAHPPFGPRGKCDVTRGPCACGATH